MSSFGVVGLEFRQILRGLVRRPAYAGASLLTLALGVGANTALFSVLRGVLLRPLPYPDFNQLAAPLEKDQSDGGLNVVSPPNFLDWRDQNRTFARLAAYNTGAMALTGDFDAVQLRSLSATEDFFPALGVGPQLGRLPAPGEMSANVVVISDSLWRKRFGGNRQLVGRSVLLDGERYTVIGVMPASFRFPVRDSADLFLPLAFPSDIQTQRGAHWLQVVGRLRRGVTVFAAQADLSRIAATLRKSFPGTNGRTDVDVAALRERVVGRVRSPLLLLMAAVALVAMLACANVANLSLAAGAARARDTALRVALGAPLSRLVKRQISESLILGLAGGALALPFSVGGVWLLRRLAPPGLPRLDDVRLDGVVLGFSLALALAAGLLSGILPALRAVAPNVQ